MKWLYKRAGQSKERIMSRPYRLQGENCSYHITSRGNGRQKIFISDFDYRQFMHYLLQGKEKYNFYLYAFVLMGNHYHLLLETTQPNLARIMHYINSAYTTYYNLKRNKYGHLFLGRYKSILVDKDSYLLELTRYIHLNPVRAKLVTKPESYKWSSYQGYLKKAGDGYIDKKQVKKDIPLSSEHYKQFVLKGITGTRNPLKMVNLRKLKHHSSKEKNVAIYLLKRYSNLSNAEIGKHFGLSYSSVSKAADSLEKQMYEDKGLQKEINGIISHFKG
ncbi:transposase [Candidatus Parvarchaeota archaeon]|nr:transposase [Candidatus Parvarchaeota archaeon]